MKIYSKIKNEQKCVIRILGLNVYHSSIKGRWHKINYFYGLLKIKKSPNIKKIYLCGIQIYSRKSINIEEITNNLKNAVVSELKNAIINETRMANAVVNLNSKI